MYLVSRRWSARAAAEEAKARIPRVYVPGLRNLGNTCYLNSLVQALAALPDLSVYLERLAPFRVPLASLLASVLQDLNATSDVPLHFVDMGGVVAFLERTLSLQFYEQQDPHELMHLLFSGIDLSLQNYQDNTLLRSHWLDAAPLVPSHFRRRAGVYTRSSSVLSKARACQASSIDAFDPECEAQDSDDSEPEDWTAEPAMLARPPRPPFNGLLGIESHCRACDRHATLRTESFSDIGLQLRPHVIAGDSKPTLEALLRRLTSPEALADFCCPGCGKAGGTEASLRFLRLPPVLVFQIRRAYSQTNTLAAPLKDATHVGFGDTVDMAPFLRFGGSGGFNSNSSSGGGSSGSSGSSRGWGGGGAVAGPSAGPSAEGADDAASAAAAAGAVAGTASPSGATEAPPVPAVPASLFDSEPAPAASRYDLAAVVVHHGQHAVGGHYSTFRALRPWSHSHATKAWAHVNDRESCPVAAGEVHAAEATLLFYNRL